MSSSSSTPQGETGPDAFTALQTIPGATAIPAFSQEQDAMFAALPASGDEELLTRLAATNFNKPRKVQYSVRDPSRDYEATKEWKSYEERQADSRTSREEAKARQEAAMQQLRETYPDSYGALDNKDFLKKIRRAQRSQREAEKAARLEAMTPHERQLLAYHEDHPLMTTKEGYVPLLNEFRGTNDYTVANREWLGKTPKDFKTGDYKEYNKLAKNFGEMVGLLQMRPKEDKRLLTEASAKHVFNPKDHTFKLYDMDNDPATPGTLVISRNAYTKHKYNPRTGEVTDVPVPEHVVAVGGYRIPQPTSGLMESVVGNMDYYDENDTRFKRKQQSMKAFREANPLNYAPRHVRQTGWKIITDMFRKVFASLGVTIPTSGYSLLRIGTNATSDGKVAHLKMTSVVWNTLLKRMAQLFGYYHVFPIVLHIMDSYTGLKSPAVKAFEAVLEPIDPSERKNYLGWMDNEHLLPEEFESVLLNDKDIQKYLSQALEQVLKSMTAAQLGIITNKLLNVATFAFLNLPLESLFWTTSRLFKNQFNNKRPRNFSEPSLVNFFLRRYQENQIVVSAVTDAEFESLKAGTDPYGKLVLKPEADPVIAVTGRSWKTDRFLTSLGPIPFIDVSRYLRGAPAPTTTSSSSAGGAAGQE